MKKILAAILVFLFFLVVLTKGQGNVAALVNKANVFTSTNTFLAGTSLPGTGGAVLITAPAVSGGITYMLPGLPGIPGYALCIGSIPGALAYCPPPGGGAGVPTVNLAPAALNFGTVSMNVTTSLQILVENTGTAPLIFSANSLVMSGMSAGEIKANTNCSTPLDAGWVCKTLVMITSLSTGPKYAQLAFNDNAAGSPQVVVITGTGGN